MNKFKLAIKSYWYKLPFTKRFVILSADFEVEGVVTYLMKDKLTNEEFYRIVYE